MTGGIHDVFEKKMNAAKPSFPSNESKEVESNAIQRTYAKKG